MKTDACEALDRGCLFLNSAPGAAHETSSAQALKTTLASSREEDLRQYQCGPQLLHQRHKEGPVRVCAGEQRHVHVPTLLHGFLCAR
eukprot:CAMPEP_0119493410 /NCGR_PEP_ID=MMETSP1344-20130328/17675_1 /TAXON_ID=236787 /ORGANISM="Florenciella parvula, Strain CCMP2471" /LENGTH=86 /DNA_ID=CAMNT_0007528833 /DNA_START=33 /DNA_END=293 /DNA_ORIENTATION=+